MHIISPPPLQVFVNGLYKENKDHVEVGETMMVEACTHYTTDIAYHVSCFALFSSKHNFFWYFLIPFVPKINLSSQDRCVLIFSTTVRMPQDGITFVPFFSN